MFIFDEGNAEQLPALKAHINDNAFEVKLQIEMAISRIENKKDTWFSMETNGKQNNLIGR